MHTPTNTNNNLKQNIMLHYNNIENPNLETELSFTMRCDNTDYTLGDAALESPADFTLDTDEIENETEFGTEYYTKHVLTLTLADLEKFLLHLPKYILGIVTQSSGDDDYYDYIPSLICQYKEFVLQLLALKIQQVELGPESTNEDYYLHGTIETIRKQSKFQWLFLNYLLQINQELDYFENPFENDNE